MASSAIVIKVKFEETLRRFSASIHDKKLVLDIAMLRAKIRTLFSFDSDVDFTLTYVDEDGDVVTLADDDDLHDAFRQSLNPLRITVKLNSKHGELDGTSTPPRSPQDQLQETLNSGFSEFLKSVPEPLRDPLTKLPIELASKAASSTPVLAELMERMKAVYLNQISDAMAGPKASDTTGASNADGRKGKNSESSTVKDGKVVDPEVGSSNLKKKEGKVRKVTEGVKFKDVQPIRPVDLNIPYFEYEAFPSPIGGVDEEANGQVSDISAKKNKDTTDGVKKSKGSGVENVSGSDKKDVSSGSLSGAQPKPVGFANPFDYLRQYVQDCKATEMGGSSSAEFTKVANDSGSSSGWAQGMLDATNQCPFVGTPLPSDSTLHGYHHPSRSPHWKRYSHGNGLGSVTFHRGVRCDGCGVHPITGPRFMSKVKEDYDLCSVCFAGMGNVADYIRMDRPTAFKGYHHLPFKGFHDHSLRIPPPTLPHALRAPGAKLPRVKLDSRFILDVNILDGTIMAPLTAFTKIWRMRNNGTVIWPCGSQLQWIGGDRLSNTVTVEVEIPADGLSVDKELDIAVDFTAPEHPGRYVSYWRMAAPSGQKFGQRVWVLIQVDASMKDLGETSINLNLPPVTRNPESINQDPVMDSILPGNIIKVTDSEDTSVSSQPKDREKNFPINDTLIINNGGASNTSTTLSPLVGPAGSMIFNSTEVETALAPLPSGPPISSGYLSTGVDNPWASLPAGPSISSALFTPEESDTLAREPVTYPTVDSSGLLPAMVSAAASPTVPVMRPSSSATGVKNDDHEKVLVRELEDMGFMQLNLNKEILRMNNYDLEKSIEDLCGVSDWDPMLEELQEMGFSDNEANRRLLKKNNGSIKRVVMDLLNGEQA